MSVCAFNSLSHIEYSNLFNVAAFSSKSFSGKNFCQFKKSYLLTFPDDKTEILEVCLSKLYCDLFCLILLLNALIFSVVLIFVTSSS